MITYNPMVLPLATLVFFTLLVGLVVGSFLNVVIHRVPRGESIVWPRSRCPWCGAMIRARDNLPLLSFLLLRARCRQCSAPISWRYPSIEALTAASFIACLLRFGLRPQAAVAAVFCSLLIALAAIDAEHLLLPDELTLPGILAGLAAQAPSVLFALAHAEWSSWALTGLAEAFIGCLCGAGLLFLLAEAWLWLRGEEGMGLGDAKLMAVVGAFLGWKGALMALLFGCLAGALVGLLLLALGRAGSKSRLPFGLFLAAGAAAALFAGPGLVDRYLQLL